MSIPIHARPFQLQSHRLVLRDFCTSDWPAVHAFRGDPAVARYMDFSPEDEVESLRWLERVIFHSQLMPRTVYNLAIVLKSGNGLIGWIGMGRLREPRELRVFDVGYCLARAFWGRGYMTEALRTLLDFAFEGLEATRVFADCHPENGASAHVLQKAGMRNEGPAVGTDTDCACLRYGVSAGQYYSADSHL